MNAVLLRVRVKRPQAAGPGVLCGSDPSWQRHGVDVDNAAWRSTKARAAGSGRHGDGANERLAGHAIWDVHALIGRR